MHEIIYARNNPTENDFWVKSYFWVNQNTDQLFLKTPKGWLKVPTEYKVIHKIVARQK